jgi:hypothetical protein
MSHLFKTSKLLNTSGVISLHWIGCSTWLESAI